MGIITEDMRDIFARARLSFAATVNADGTPNLSPKATLMVYDDDHLVFANIASPNTMANLARNPSIECNVVDVFARRRLPLQGQGRSPQRGAGVRLRDPHPAGAGGRPVPDP